ncbi:protein ACCELERATED CELL DEATH 6-like [Prunus yedoensis var. nudiflora]|uniref:Protein ACCELERATED CELL DEATH 6-like n=1 Tax=Prunus yedoensis var. nudiflora TaxID=2094558 RepID=A0A314YET3_PRUYE|nr:protein ACCELERATED CELL DEATH 6-like [Prunus yedoensis var. nudiflora]
MTFRSKDAIGLSIREADGDVDANASLRIVQSGVSDIKPSWERKFVVETLKLESGTETKLPLQKTKPHHQTQDFEETDRDPEILSLYQQLYNYATLGKKDIFNETIAKKCHDPNVQVQLLSRLSPQNCTLVHIAVSFGHAELAAEILQRNESNKALLFKKNMEGDTALHIAVKAGDLVTTKTLLQEAKATTDVENNDDLLTLLTMKNDEENTALHEALIRGHQSVAKYLIEVDPAVSLDANKEQKSTLYLAAEEGFDEIVKLIHKRAVEKNSEVFLHGKSPLHAAILGRRNKELLKIISGMEEIFLNPKDEEGRTPLHCAASIGYVEGVRFLLGTRLSDSHRKDNDGNFPIHSSSSKGHVDIVKELLRHCPDSKELKNSSGENILHVAARCGKDNLVNYFLKMGEFQMLINQKDNEGNTPLHLATKRHHPKVVYILTWDRRTNLKLVNDRGMTALDVAEGSLETIATYHGRLTRTILKSAGAQRAQSLHVLLRQKTSSQVPDKGGEFATKSEDAGTKGSTHSKLPNEESIRDRVNTLLVVATLVATVTFAAGFTMPGGYNSSSPQEGMATLLNKDMFQAFVICNTIAMYSAVLVTVCLIWAQLGDLNLVYAALRLALPLLAIALTMMSLAFMVGVYVVVSDLHWLSYVVLILGVLFIFTVLVVFIPFVFETTSRFRMVRYITYFPFCMEVLASGSLKDDQEVLASSLHHKSPSLRDIVTGLQTSRLGMLK